MKVRPAACYASLTTTRATQFVFRAPAKSFLGAQQYANVLQTVCMGLSARVSHDPECYLDRP